MSRATPSCVIPNNHHINWDYSDRGTDASVCGISNRVDTGPQVAVGWTTHSASSATVRIASLTDEAASNESMGIVMVELWVK